MANMIAKIYQTKQTVWMFVRNGSSSVEMEKSVSMHITIFAMVKGIVGMDQTKKIVKITPVLNIYLPA